MNDLAPIDQATKDRLLDALADAVRSRLEANEAIVAEERSAAELGDGTTHSVDDLSQSDEEGELSGLHAAAADDLRAALAAATTLDRGPADTVAPGALIGLDGDGYVVGVATPEFEFEGRSWSGLATDAPIYAALAGLAAGDSVEFRGHTSTVDWIA